jgi:hypothetical protein
MYQMAKEERTFKYKLKACQKGQGKWLQSEGQVASVTVLRRQDRASAITK